MRSVNICSTKPDRYAQAPQQQAQRLPAQQPYTWPLSPCDDRYVLIAKRAYGPYGEQGYQGGSALDDWLDAEREILSQIPPA